MQHQTRTELATVTKYIAYLAVAILIIFFLGLAFYMWVYRPIIREFLRIIVGV